MKTTNSNIKPIAIHLPQYHPFFENDKWWGKGFTEWTNVTKAKPLFKGHYQPHLPADLGFYDLRLEESRIAQAELAKEYGIYGFCYYHYWFTGKRLLNRPLDEMLKTGTPDFPFLLCWANENWTRRWDGLDNELLIKQEYSYEDDLNHIRFLCESFFGDNRYIRHNGKPFFIVYRPALFPNLRKTIDTWRNECVRLGLGDLYLGFMSHHTYESDFVKDGFDCQIEFQPTPANLPQRVEPNLVHRLKQKFRLSNSPFSENTVYRYPEFVDKTIKNMSIRPNTFPGITPGWDNSARRQKGANIFIDSTPQEYERWLNKIRQTYTSEETYLFINAWNEWAEGNHLEPCQKWGKSYLEATRKVLGNA